MANALRRTSLSCTGSLLREIDQSIDKSSLLFPFAVREIESANALQPVGASKDLGMAESSHRVVEAGLPMFLHGPSGKLEILGHAFVALAVIDELDDVA